jgi:hypothetical protein
LGKILRNARKCSEALKTDIILLLKRNRKEKDILDAARENK